MSGSVQSQIIANSQRLAELHAHAREVDDKLAAIAVQVAVADSHVTTFKDVLNELKQQARETDAKVDALANLKAQVIGGVAVVGVIVTGVVEALRFLLH